MLRTIIALLAMFVTIANPVASSAAGLIDDLTGIEQKPIQVALDREQFLSGQNPPSTWMNGMQRNERIGFGAFMWATLCGTNTTCAGAYSNLSILPVTTLYVAVGPSNSNTVGQLYQFLPEETTGFGGYPSGIGTFLPADATQVMLQGTTTTNTANIGPMVAGASPGQTVDNLVECKVVTLDTNSATVNIVSSGGSVTATSANEKRRDTISCQGKAGVSATTGTQTIPSLDSGYVSVGYVAVPYGTTSVTGGMVNAITSSAFTGFANASPYGANAVVLSPSSQQTGSINVSGGVSAGGAMSGTTGTFSGAVSAQQLQATNGYLYLNSGGTQYLNYTGSAFGFSGPVQSSSFVGGTVSGTSGTFTSSLAVESGNGGQVTVLTDGTNTIFQGGPYVFENVGGASFEPITAGSITTNSSINSTQTNGTLNFNGSGPGTISNANNYVSIVGSNATSGVQIGNSNGSATNIAQFNTVGSGVAFVLRSGAYSNPSDRRLKKNIDYHPAYGLSSVMQLRPVTFNWVDNRTGGKRDIGFIAQDVKAIPGLAPLVAKPGQFYGINYAQFAPVLTAAIQEQQRLIQKQAAAIKTLEAQVLRLMRAKQ